jgi:hypothetical protein
MRHFKSHSFFTLMRRDSVNIATEFPLLISAMSRKSPLTHQVRTSAFSGAQSLNFKNGKRHGTDSRTHNDGVPCSNQGVATIF